MNLVELRPLLEPHDAIFDMRYARADNIAGEVLYDDPEPRLDGVAAEALAYATRQLAVFSLRVVIWDAYRPPEAHQRLRAVNSDERYVLENSNHPKGLAVDVTLARSDGSYLDMGTDFDDFSELSHSYVTGLNPAQLNNRLLLAGNMSRVGFKRWPYEWWHFDYNGHSASPTD